MKLKTVLFVCLEILLLGAFAFWILITPDNPLTNLFRREISDPNARVIIGPYPLEQDFRLLKSHQVTTVVSLLDPRLPYERVLLDQERERARQYQIQLLSFPMASIFGQRLGEDYDQHAAAAAEAIARETGKVYLHCYLGLHRIKAVENLLRARGTIIGPYLVRQAERTEHALLLERAQADYDAGRYRPALEKLEQLKQLDLPARLLQAWATYRLENIPAARSLFNEILQTTPNSTEARTGLGYCAFRGNDLDSADHQFSVVLQGDPNDAAALVGMGLVRYRQNRLDEATQHLEAALKLNPRNPEAQEILGNIARQRTALGEQK